MDDSKILKFVYTLFLGVIVALFIGVGINTFYPGPKPPEYPMALNYYGKEPTAEQLKLQKNWDQQVAAHDKQMKPYNRNVSMVALAAAIILLVVSLIFERGIKLLSDGMLIGGLLTLLYSIGRGFASNDSKYVFLALCVGLAIVIYTGYMKFIARSHRDNTNSII